MNKIAKSSIIKGRELSFGNDTNFKDYQKRYPLKEVESCHYSVKANRHDGLLLLDYSIKSKLFVYDTRDNEVFLYPKNIEEKVEVLDENDWEKEGYVVSGANIDLDDLALRIIQSSLPLRLVKDENEPMPKGINGFNIVDEDELKEDVGNFSLDGLPDFPSMNDK